MAEYMCYAELAVGVIGIVFGIRTEVKRRREREWVHMALKPSIQGSNQAAVIAAIKNMLEFLKSPPRKK